MLRGSDPLHSLLGVPHELVFLRGDFVPDQAQRGPARDDEQIRGHGAGRHYRSVGEPD